MSYDDYESLPTNSIVVHMTAGSIAGIAEHSVTFPFDCVKVRLTVHVLYWENPFLQSGWNGMIGNSFSQWSQLDWLHVRYLLMTIPRDGITKWRWCALWKPLITPVRAVFLTSFDVENWRHYPVSIFLLAFCLLLFCFRRECRICWIHRLRKVSSQLSSTSYALMGPVLFFEVLVWSSVERALPMRCTSHLMRS